MKLPVMFTRLQAILFVILFQFICFGASSQDSGSTETKTTTTTTRTTDVNITTDSGAWYTQPWVWIVGAAAFILLLVALLSSGKSRNRATTTDRVTVKKTIERDTD